MTFQLKMAALLLFQKRMMYYLVIYYKHILLASICLVVLFYYRFRLLSFVVNMQSVPYVGDQVLKDFTVLKEILPECEYHPSYAREHTVEKYEGYLEVFESSTYPDDHTWRLFVNADDGGNPLVPAKIVNAVEGILKDALMKNYKTFSELKIRLLESTPNAATFEENELKMWRLIVDAEILWTTSPNPTYISQYFVLKETELSSDFEMCSIKGHQWNPGSRINIVIAVKNGAAWIKYLVDNIEDIYLKTGDENLVLVIVDFHSTDVDIQEILEASKLKPQMYKLLTLEGNFERARGLQAGIDWVIDPNEIVMTIDLHLDIPSGMLQSIRKHTIQGRMGYTPEVFRLEAGFSKSFMRGVWELKGYGLMSLYKSDWVAIGGENVEEYGEVWGGEDWDCMDRLVAKGLEVFRHKYPGLLHNYHSHKGMWSNHKGLWSE